MDSERGDGYALEIRSISKRLIALDNEVNGLPIADMAVHCFKAVHRRMGAGDYPTKTNAIFKLRQQSLPKSPDGRSSTKENSTHLAASARKLSSLPN
ncbi:hypothetical protein NKH77_31930 [Streptomyces sp. M19]